MKHEKEWYTCDRCGAEIKMTPSDAQFFHFARSIRCSASSLETITAEKSGFVTKENLISPEIESVEIVEFYDVKHRKIHLCGKCRKAVKRFMSREEPYGGQ